MSQPHETFFFLTGGTGPRPTCAAFFAAAAQRTAKTKENRRKSEERKGKLREDQIQREKALEESGGVRVGVMRLLGLRGVGEKGVVRKGRGNEGKQADTEGKASGGNAEEKDSAGERERDVPGSKQPEKEAVENDTIQSASYDAGILHSETDAGDHHGVPHIHCDNAGDKSPTKPTTAPAPDPDDDLDLDYDQGAAPLPVLLKNTLSGSKSDINPDDIQPPIIVPAPDPDGANDLHNHPPQLSPH